MPLGRAPRQRQGRAVILDRMGKSACRDAATIVRDARPARIGLSHITPATQVDVVRPSVRWRGSAAASYAKRPGQSESFIDPASNTLHKVLPSFQHCSIAWLTGENGLWYQGL
jgi:hypothetical protein